ncbi:hypothetical protein [Flagellimonas onchidii]|uniref:hypothetical protein n=1 Tax=Flagellimonas onchidii TaxID=2562684 RepID=UPI0010A637B3|nr:hypothetical protein [Allomuricauda onchidii]
MKTQKRHIWFSTILISVLLFQWSFNFHHVFTSHSFHSQDKVDNSHEAVFGSDFDCELCAKLNTKPASLFFAPKIAFTFTLGDLPTFWEDHSVFTSLQGLNPKRGPPAFSSFLYAFLSFEIK